jgi:Iron/manganese superoxide dismutases, alpha-hairpin domain
MAMMLARRKLQEVVVALGARAMCTSMVAGPEAVQLPDLPYDFSALEPHISGEIMELHHSKHHKAYVDNYNKALEQWQAAHEKQDSTSVPALASALHFNGGGSHRSSTPLYSVTVFPSRVSIRVAARNGK